MLGWGRGTLPPPQESSLALLLPKKVICSPSWSPLCSAFGTWGHHLGPGFTLD